VGRNAHSYGGLDWIGSVIWWIGLDWILKNGPTDISDTAELTNMIIANDNGMSSALCLPVSFYIGLLMDTIATKVWTDLYRIF